MRVTYLLGIDGSGKTTLAESLVFELKNQGIEASRFYGRYHAVLLWPAKFLARHTLMRGTNEHADYAGYSERKAKGRSRYPVLAWIYGMLWVTDYVLGTWARLAVFLGRTREIIMDRYYLDQAVNIAVALQLTDAQLLRLARTLARFFPRPCLSLLLDLSPSVAYQRKDDIQAVEYLEERRRLYHVLAPAHGLIVIDGSQPPDQVLRVALGLLPVLRLHAGACSAHHSVGSA